MEAKSGSKRKAIEEEDNEGNGDDEEHRQGGSSGSDSDSSDSGSSSDEEKPEEDHIDVDFEALAPISDDYWGIKALLTQLLPSSVNHGDVADLLIAEDELTSIVKIEQPEDVAEENESEVKSADEGASKGEEEEEEHDDTYDLYAVTSIIDLPKHNAKECMEKILAWITSKTDGDNERALLKAWNRDRTGLVLSNRFVNIPPQLGAGLYTNLVSDLSEANKSGKCKQFKKVIYLSKCYEQTQSRVKGKGKARKKPKKTEATSSAGSGPLFFVCPEDDIFKRNSETSFHFPSKAGKSADELGGDFRQCICVMILSMTEFCRSVKAIEKAHGLE